MQQPEQDVIDNFRRYFFHSLDLIPVPVLVSAPVLDPQTGEEINRLHLHVNKAFIQELGYQLTEVPDMQSWFARAYPDLERRAYLTQQWMDAVQQALAIGEEIVQMPGLITCANGQQRWFEVRAQLKTYPQLPQPVLPDWHIVTFKDIHHLRSSLDQIQLLSDKDPLTQLYNRRGMEHWLKQQQVNQIGVVLIDLDHFKQLNDIYGHFAGDHLLVLMGSLLNQVCRPQDCAVRWGGEEFVLLLPSTDLTTTLQRAEQLRRRFAEAHFSWYGQQISATLSAGCSSGTLDPNNSLASTQQVLQLLQQADDALYQAKLQGRNRVLVG
jgi:diguanylate cyclase (GGDEF)-like protein